MFLFVNQANFGFICNLFIFKYYFLKVKKCTCSQSQNTHVLKSIALYNHLLNVPEFEQSPVGSEEQGRLAFCSPWGHKEPDMTK